MMWYESIDIPKANALEYILALCVKLLTSSCFLLLMITRLCGFLAENNIAADQIEECIPAVM